MKRWRIAFVGCLAMFLVLGHLYDLTTHREHWPFSYYPMYARVQKRTRLQILTLYMRAPGTGVGHDGKRPQLIRMNDTGVPPFTATGMRNILMAAADWRGEKISTVQRKKTATVLRAYLKKYEARRAAGLSSGPRMLEALVCRETFPLGDADDAPPHHIELLLGVKRDGTEVDYDREKRTVTTTQILNLKPSTQSDEEDQ